MIDNYETLKVLPCFEGFSAIQLIPVNEGYSQSVFKVFCYKTPLTNTGIENTTKLKFKLKLKQPDAIYIAKRFNKTVSAALEAEVASYSGNVGIGVAPQYCDDTWLISEFAHGQTLAATQLPLIDKTRLCLQALSALHKTPLGTLVQPQTLNIDNVLEYFVSNARLSKKIKALFWQIISDFNVEHSLQPHAYIHGDANFSNIIFSSTNINNSRSNMLEQARLIDFEAVSIAPIAYELGMLNAINTLSLGLIEQVIKEVDDFNVVDIRLVTRYSVLSCIINGLWFMSEFGANKEFRYENMAFSQFKYLDELTQHTYQLTNQLKQMR